MTMTIGTSIRQRWAGFGVAVAALVTLIASPVPAGAQMTPIDPNSAIDADLVPAQPAVPTGPAPAPTPPTADPATGAPSPTSGAADAPSPTSGAADAPPMPAAAPPGATYARDDLIGAAEGVFGKGAEGLAKLIEDILRNQGEPNAYIVGREAGGAFVVGLRYGSGKLFHKVEGERPVYWTGPSIGFDAGANAGKTFVLVYNLFDSDDLYKRFPAGEGQAYLVGGFNASYLRRGNIVLIPIRVGVGLRLGANVGYMKFSKRQRWLPF